MDRITASCMLQFNERSTNSWLIYARPVKFAAGLLTASLTYLGRTKRGTANEARAFGARDEIELHRFNGMELSLFSLYFYPPVYV